VKELIEEHIKPVTEQMTDLQWIVGTMALGVFFGFLDTLLIACVLGYLKLQVPAYFGIPTTFSGYFFAGVVIGRLAPARITWQASVGILICALVFMFGYGAGGDQGSGLMIVQYGLLPAVSVALFCLGKKAARRNSRCIGMPSSKKGQRNTNPHPAGRHNEP